jgi:hypothetical protein
MLFPSSLNQEILHHFKTGRKRWVGDFENAAAGREARRAGAKANSRA